MGHELIPPPHYPDYEAGLRLRRQYRLEDAEEAIEALVREVNIGVYELMSFLRMGMDEAVDVVVSEVAEKVAVAIHADNLAVRMDRGGIEQALEKLGEDREE
jgi:hypothetical protein